MRLALDSYASCLDVFKTALYPSCNSSSNLVGGLPANNVFVKSTPISQWADVEVKQAQNVVTMSINHTPILSYANTNSACTTASFTLESSSLVNGTYAMDVTASLTQLGPGSFQVTCPQNGPAEFYRIKHN